MSSDLQDFFFVYADCAPNAPYSPFCSTFYAMEERFPAQAAFPLPSEPTKYGGRAGDCAGDAVARRSRAESAAKPQTVRWLRSRQRTAAPEAWRGAVNAAKETSVRPSPFRRRTPAPSLKSQLTPKRHTCPRKNVSPKAIPAEKNNQKVRRPSQERRTSGTVNLCSLRRTPRRIRSRAEGAETGDDQLNQREPTQGKGRPKEAPPGPRSQSQRTSAAFAADGAAGVLAAALSPLTRAGRA